MPVRGPIHIASEAARREQRRTGHTTRCGVPLVDAAFYWDKPTHDDLLDDTCVTCVHTYNRERKTDGKPKIGRRCGAHFGH